MVENHEGLLSRHAKMSKGGFVCVLPNTNVLEGIIFHKHYFSYLKDTLICCSCNTNRRFIFQCF